jgi:uncharacterized protein YecE (DUF72 family)
MLYLGTSGFSYNDWVGPVYPRGTRSSDWLRLYAREFNALELNSTYYAVPRPSVVKSLIERTETGFLFAVKAHGDITHGRQPDDALLNDFKATVQLFNEAGKLGCVLLQFPHSFTYTLKHRSYLDWLRERFKDIPLVVEFRNIGWIKPEVFNWLRCADMGFCCVDEPRLPNLIPPVAEVTGRIAYLRFHGRNALKWWDHEEAWQRYDYSYSPEELKEWIPSIRKLREEAERTFIFANNHWRGQSVNTIRQLRLMLD